MSGFTQIGVGSSANDDAGDPLRTAYQAINGNYTSTVRAVASTSSLSSEEAAAGFVRVLYNDLGGQSFVADNSGLTVDDIKVFASATVGWVWVRTMPACVDITAPRFRCIGDDSADNTTNLQAASDYAFANNLPLRIPAGTYKVTDFINFYDLIVLGDGRERSIIKSYASAKPIGVFNGSHGQVKSISLNYDSQKTDPSCANMLFTGYDSPGQVGWYWGTINDVGLTNGDTPMHTTAELATVLSSSALSGATSITVDAITESGFYDIVAGAYITVTLDSGSQVVQVDSISGTTLTLRTALTGAATAGNQVFSKKTTWFSNSVDNIYIRKWNRYAFIQRGSGTGSSITNFYCANGDAETYPTCVGAFYFGSFNDCHIGQINCEWFTATANSVVAFFGGDTIDSGSWHFEGVKFGGTNQSLFGTTQKSFEAKGVTIDGWDVPNSVGVFGLVRFESVSSGYSPVFKLEGVVITNSRFETPNNFYYGIDLNSNNSRFLIDNLTLNKDSGCKARGQLMSPSTSSPTLKRLKPFFDENILAYGLRASASTISDVTIYSRSKKISPQTLAIGNSPLSLSTAVAQVRDASGGGGNALFASSALSAITGLSTYFKANNDAGIDNTIIDLSADGRLYFRVTTAQSGVSVSGSSVSVSRTNSKADGGTGISRINWSTDPGIEVGDLITTSGFTDTTFNGTFIVVGSGSDYVEFYKYTGSAKATTADTGGSINRVAVVDIFIKGVDWGRELL